MWAFAEPLYLNKNQSNKSAPKKDGKYVEECSHPSNRTTWLFLVGNFARLQAIDDDREKIDSYHKQPKYFPARHTSACSLPLMNANPCLGSTCSAPLETIAFCPYFGASFPETQQVGKTRRKSAADLGEGGRAQPLQPCAPPIPYHYPRTQGNSSRRWLTWVNVYKAVEHQQKNML